MNSLTTEPAPRDTVRDLVTSRGKITVGSSGAVSTSELHGLTVTKTAGKSGRYTVQAVDSSGSSCALRQIEHVSVSIWSPTADNPITTGAASNWCLRGVSESTGTLYLQFVAPTYYGGTGGSGPAVTTADADLENGAIFTVEIKSVRNAVTP